MNDISNLKVGDQVAYYSDSGIPMRKTIVRETKTLWFLEFRKVFEDGTFQSGFRKSDGHPPGDCYQMSYIAPLTPELLARIEDAKLRKRLSSLGREVYDLATQVASKGSDTTLVDVEFILRRMLENLRPHMPKKAETPS